jgi:preprotein translocase subunit SecG
MTEGILAGRQATSVLTRATWIAGSVFMVLAFILAIMSSRAVQPQSILRDDVQTAPIPQPVLPGIEGVTEGTTPPGGGDPGEPGTL